LAGCVCVVPQGAQLTAAGRKRCVVVALRIPVLLDCRKLFQREQARATLQRLSHMDGWSLFRRSTLYYTPAQTVPQHGDSVEPFVALFDGGKSLAGLMSKKPLGFNRKPMAATGITCVGVKGR
jgi:hypothetical protein